MRYSSLGELTHEALVACAEIGPVVKKGEEKDDIYAVIFPGQYFLVHHTDKPRDVSRKVVLDAWKVHNGYISSFRSEFVLDQPDGISLQNAEALAAATALSEEMGLSLPNMEDLSRMFGVLAIIQASRGEQDV